MTYKLNIMPTSLPTKFSVSITTKDVETVEAMTEEFGWDFTLCSDGVYVAGTTANHDRKEELRSDINSALGVEEYQKA
jgi:hypothetical protein